MAAHIFTWSQDYSVGVELLDEQHKHFISSMNDVFEAITGACSSERKLYALIAKIAKSGKKHFATEEKYFDLFQYEYSEEHKAQHKKILDYLDNFLSVKPLSYKQAGTELLGFLEVWLIDHLAYWDKKYTKCFNKHGLK